VKLDFRIGFSGNEPGVRDAFAIIHKRLGFRIRVSQKAFPDYRLESYNGKMIDAEAEHEATGYTMHVNRPEKCDLLICWRDNWPECTIPKLVLSRYAQERPRFEGFSQGQPPKISALLESHEAVSMMLKGFYFIGFDVMDLFSLDYSTVICETTRSSLHEDSSIEKIRQKDRYYVHIFSCYRGGWDPTASSIRLNVDFDQEVFEVCVDLSENSIKERGIDRWRRIIGEVSKKGYLLEGVPKGNSRDAVTAFISTPEKLLSAIAEGSISSTVFVKRLKFAEVFLSDPYDIAAGLHDELDWMLDFMEQEGLYVSMERTK
jgi:hypothetical protein